MTSFGSNRSIASTTAKVRSKKSRYMVHDEINGFFAAIRSDPVLIHRFSKVPVGTVRTLADKIFDVLSTSWKEGLGEMIMPLFELKIMANIQEPEVDALFTHFIDEYNGPVDGLAIDFWNCLKEEKKIVTSTTKDIDENIKKLSIRRNSESMTEKSFFVNATNSVRQDDEKIEESFGEQGSSN